LKQKANKKNYFCEICAKKVCYKMDAKNSHNKTGDAKKTCFHLWVVRLVVIDGSLTQRLVVTDGSMTQSSLHCLLVKVPWQIRT